MKKFLTKKNITWAIVTVIVLFVGYLIFRPRAVTYKEAYTVAKQDVRQTVIATGTVTSESSLNLAFKSTGILSRLNVKVGDKVKKGQILAMLDEKDAVAAIAQAQAQVQSAQANLNKVLYGTADSDIAVYQIALDNALSAWLNSYPQGVPDNGNTTATLAVHGIYTGKEQGSYYIRLYNSAGGISYVVSGLSDQVGIITRGLDLPIGKGLYINFSTDGLISTMTNWTITIPNTLASNYLTNYNAYKSAEATLAQKKALARPEDVETARASLASAEASLQIANNTYTNNIIQAPIDGLITSVDVKLGEQVSALKEAIVLLDQTDLHVESNIPESSIGLVSLDQTIDMTLDAFGPDKHLTGTVLSIDPASTVISGVIEFRVISSLPTDPLIRPGMTVNLNIIVTDKPDTLAIPNRLIKTSSGKKTVMLSQQGQISEVEIQAGLIGDNYTEITSGLSLGDVVVVIGK